MTQAHRRRRLAAAGAAFALALAGRQASATATGPADGDGPGPAASHLRTRLIPADSTAVGDNGALPVVFVLPDEVWDERRAWPYLDRLALRGVAAVEVFTDDDQRPTPDAARDAIAAAAAELGLEPSRVALLGFGSGGRLALALARPGFRAVALYPVCHAAPPPDPAARVLVLHPDAAPEAAACAGLTDGRPEAHARRAAPGAGHGWDVVGQRSDGRTMLPDPGAPDDPARRLAAHPDAWVTFRAAQAVAGFLVGESAAVGAARPQR